MMRCRCGGTACSQRRKKPAGSRQKNNSRDVLKVCPGCVIFAASCLVAVKQQVSFLQRSRLPGPAAACQSVLSEPVAEASREGVGGFIVSPEDLLSLYKEIGVLRALHTQA